MSSHSDISIEDIISDIKRSIVDSKHPYRRVVLSTMNQQHGVQSRTLILRALTLDNQLILYTDTRSPKVAEIQSDGRVSVLLYYHRRSTQIRINGNANILRKGPLVEYHKNNLQTYQYNDYNTIAAPGDKMESDPSIIARDNKLNFSIIVIDIRELDHLKLDRSGHLRVAFSYNGANWTKRSINP